MTIEKSFCHINIKKSNFLEIICLSNVKFLFKLKNYDKE